MIEKLPKDCASVIDKFPKAFGKDAVLGLAIECNRSGNNKFTLAVVSEPKSGNVYGVSFGLSSYVTIPSLNKIVQSKHPDLMFRPKHFMPLDKFIEIVGGDCREKIAQEILSKLKSMLKSCIAENKRWNPSSPENWCGTINLELISCYDFDGDKKLDFNPVAFSSFSELLVWIDLNVKWCIWKSGAF